MQTEADAKQLYQKALDLLARREHSRFELYRKLCRYTSDHDVIDQTLTRLADDGLQNDQRFAETYLAFRSQKGYGPERIRQELKQRKIDRAIINEALEQCEIDWPTLASAVRIKRFGEETPQEAVDRAKQQQFLFYRGFSTTNNE